MSNSIKALLVAKSVALPAAPLDLSLAFRTTSVSRAYVIVMAGRSGSTWLASALAQLPGFGNPIEYFNEEVLPHYWQFAAPQSFSDMFTGIVHRYADTGCFGFKINPQRLFWLARFVDLETTFAPTHTAWIEMRRWNLVKQALSFAVAKKSGIWHTYTGGAAGRMAASEMPEIGDGDLWRELLAVLSQEQTMDRFCANRKIAPLRIHYEEIFDSKASLLTRVCAFARPGVPFDISHVVDGTAKLDKNSYASREVEFTLRHADMLNEIYTNRAQVSVPDLQRRVAELPQRL